MGQWYTGSMNPQLNEEDDFDIRETYAAQFAVMNTPECWGAPGMELYDDYDTHKPRP